MWLSWRPLCRLWERGRGKPTWEWINKTLRIIGSGNGKQNNKNNNNSMLMPDNQPIHQKPQWIWQWWRKDNHRKANHLQNISLQLASLFLSSTTTTYTNININTSPISISISWKTSISQASRLVFVVILLFSFRLFRSVSLIPLRMVMLMMSV